MIRHFSLVLALIAAAVPAAAQQADSVRGYPPVAATPPVPDSVTDTYELGAVEEMPRPRNTSDFARALMRLYPPALRDAGTQGQVLVRFRVERDGRVSRASVLHSTDPAFNEPTLRAVHLLRFSPARVRGRPVPVWVSQPVEWRVVGTPAAAAPAAASGRPPSP